MEFKEELDLLNGAEMNPTELKMTKQLLEMWLDDFWTELKEPVLTGDLKELWWWTKMHFITRLANEGNTTAKIMLEKELRKNAKKFENPAFEHYEVSWR